MSDAQGSGAGSPLDSRRELTREEALRELQHAENVRSRSRAQEAGSPAALRPSAHGRDWS
jgi:hypothetical protein